MKHSLTLIIFTSFAWLAGCGATLTALRRTCANGIGIAQTQSLDALRSLSAEEIRALLIPVDRLLERYPAVTVTEKQRVRFCHGGALDRVRVRGVGADGLYRVYDPDGVFLGAGELSGEALAVRRLMIEV